MTLEKKIAQLLQGRGPFDVIAYELIREPEGGWSVNDSWRMAEAVDHETVLNAARARWEIFKANYLPRARVQDIEDIGMEEEEISLEVGGAAFLTIRTNHQLSDELLAGLPTQP